MVDDLIPGPVSGWRLMGGGLFEWDEPRLFARFAPEAIAYFLRDQTARDFSHRAWSWVHDLAEPLPSACLVDESHDVTPAPDCGCGWRVVTDFDDMASYMRRMAGEGDHFVLAKVETVGTLRASHARQNADPSQSLDDPASTVRAEAIRVTDLYLHQETYTNPKYGDPEAWAAVFGKDAEVHVPPAEQQLTLEGWLKWVEPTTTDDLDQAAAMAYLAEAVVPTVAIATVPAADVCRFCGDDECDCDPDRPGWRFFGAFIGGTSGRPVLFSWDRFCQLMAGGGPLDADLDYCHGAELVARCTVRDHPSPDPMCECGYRLVDDLGKLHRYALRHHWVRHLPSKYEGLIAVARVQGGGQVYGPGFGDPRGTLRFGQLTVTHLYLTQQTYDRPDLYGTAEQWAEGFPDVEVHVPPPPRALAYNGKEWFSPAQWFEWIERQA